jgi:hypothetical protein
LGTQPGNPRALVGDLRNSPDDDPGAQSKSGFGIGADQQFLALLADQSASNFLVIGIIDIKFPLCLDPFDIFVADQNFPFAVYGLKVNSFSAQTPYASFQRCSLDGNFVRRRVPLGGMADARRKGQGLQTQKEYLNHRKNWISHHFPGILDS